MKIIDVICSAGRTGFYFDDQRAIKAGAKATAPHTSANPKPPALLSVRQPGESISVMLVLEDGQIAYGDCAAVQYSGCGGRDPSSLQRTSFPLSKTISSPNSSAKRRTISAHFPKWSNPSMLTANVCTPQFATA